MSKEDLDIYFSEIHRELIRYSSTLIKYSKKELDFNDLISETYLYVENLKEELETKNDLIAYSKRFMNTSTMLGDTKFKRTHLLGKHSDIEFTEPKGVYSDNIEESLETLLKGFINTLDSYEKRLFNIYYNLNLTKGKDIAKHLNVHEKTGYSVRKDAIVIYERFKNYIKENIIL